MKCINCGNEIMEGDQVCRYCGTPVNSTIGAGSSNQIQTGGQVNNGVSPMEMPNQVNQQPVMPQQSDNSTLQQQMPSQQPVYNTNPVNNNFQSMNNGMVNAMPNQQGMMNQNQKPKGNKMFVIIVSVLVVVILVLAFFILKATVLDNKDSSKEDTNTSNTETKSDDTTKTENTTDDNNVSSNDAIYESNGFKFKIPSGVSYSEESGILKIKKDNSYYFNFGTEFFSYDDVIDTYVQEIVSSFKNEGFAVGDMFETTYQNHKYYLINVSYSGYNLVYYFTTLNSSYHVEGTMFVASEQDFYDVFTIINSLIDNVDTTSSFSNSNSENKYSFNADTDIIKDSDIEGSSFTKK